MTNALFRLDGRTAFVSGAAGHLGSVMARALCEAGAHVIVNGRDDSRLEDFERDLKRAGFSAERAAFDMGDFERVRAFFAKRERLDVLVNNAISMTPKPFAALEPEDFARTYASAVTAAFEAVRAALPALRRAVQAAGDASVVNIASMYAQVAPDKRIYARPEQASPFHYGPAKAGLAQLTRHLAAELGPEKIRVNALIPGPFPRPQVSADDPAFAERLAGRTMLGRLGQAGEIAGPLLFLASRAASYVTGASVAVDGGWVQW
ncbi:MAG: SDR family oxidoreductase [Alphaproteobacteria bacterium]|nr:SDR family oxidoreductase [Alphaproteobacteria bacterium]MDE2110447.1 SDR family oxidoreductase [Alphaproteobacteria bacterium]MDE2493394.1 SDR family oxidoreductase [Alphaproteobacteria bacterium]